MLFCLLVRSEVALRGGFVLHEKKVPECLSWSAVVEIRRVVYLLLNDSLQVKYELLKRLSKLQAQTVYAFRRKKSSAYEYRDPLVCQPCWIERAHNSQASFTLCLKENNCVWIDMESTSVQKSNLHNINAPYGPRHVPPLTKYYITLHGRVWKWLAFDLQSSSETLRLNQCELKQARTDVLSLDFTKKCCMHNFFGQPQSEREPLGMKGANLEPAVEFSTRQISISNLFFAILATFVESSDVKADAENSREVQYWCYKKSYLLIINFL